MLQHLPGSDLLVVHEEVHEALEAGVGVVALESTILAHGLPHPDNIEIGAQIEDAVRAGGSVPATVAVLDGVVHIGLGAAEVERVCTDPDIAKLSVRDVGVAAALGLSGATTVASTSALAHLAGIRVFATGGLGGVHRGASETFDVSADLGVIASTPVLVVCAGVKSILDVAGTLETLETLSVPVVGYRTDAFPGFYLPDSGHPVPWRVESPARRPGSSSCATGSGPTRPGSSSPTRCPSTGRSTASCTTGWSRRGSPCSSARACTARTSRRGCSSCFHAQLRRRVAARERRARPVERPARRRGRRRGGGAVGSTRMTAGHGPTRPVVVVGDVGLDVITRPSGDIRWHSDTPSAVALVPGGAGGNSASWLAGLGAEVTLVARVGDDAAGTACRGELEAAGVTCAFAVDPALPTCMVVILLDAHGDRTMFPDRGANRAFSVADVDLASLGLPLDPRPHLHLSGYVLFDAGSRAAGLESLRQARALGWTTSVDPQSPALIEREGVSAFLSWVSGWTCCCPTRTRSWRSAVWPRSSSTRARSSPPTARPGPGGSAPTSTSRPRRPSSRTSTPPGAATPSTPGCSRPGCAARTVSSALRAGVAAGSAAAARVGARPS